MKLERLSEEAYQPKQFEKDLSQAAADRRIGAIKAEHRRRDRREAEKPRKAAAGQKEMLLPIAGKRGGAAARRRKPRKPSDQQDGVKRDKLRGTRLSSLTDRPVVLAQPRLGSLILPVRIRRRRNVDEK